MGLIFTFKEFIDEIDAISFMAKNFIRPDAIEVLPILKRKLEEIQTRGTHKSYPWGIPIERPLHTIESKQYEPGGRAPYPVFASLESVWDIRPCLLYTSDAADE